MKKFEELDRLKSELAKKKKESVVPSSDNGTVTCDSSTTPMSEPNNEANNDMQVDSPDIITEVIYIRKQYCIRDF